MSAPEEPRHDPTRDPADAVPRDLRDQLVADLARTLEANRALTGRVGRLTAGLSLLTRIAGLARSGDDRRATACAVLTGVTAGVGLGMNRAAVLVPPGPEPAARDLAVLAAIGPVDRADADRVWRAIERDAPDLETLYEVGSRALTAPSQLDRTLRDGRARLRSDGDIDAIVLTDGSSWSLDAPTRLVAPLGGDPRAGLLLADNAFTGRAPDDETRLLFSLVASLAGPALQSAARFERVSAEATTDALTGLASRRTGEAVLRETCDAAALEARPVALLLLDLDDFKRVNDTLGHPVGDAVLRETGARLRALLPARTRAFRYGGEELAVICDGLDLAQAAALAEQLRSSVSSAPVSTGRGELRVTTSIGVAAGVGLSPTTLIERADTALLRAKRAGKDRVEVES